MMGSGLGIFGGGAFNSLDFGDNFGSSGSSKKSKKPAAATPINIQIQQLADAGKCSKKTTKTTAKADAAAKAAPLPLSSSPRNLNVTVEVERRMLPKKEEVVLTALEDTGSKVGCNAVATGNGGIHHMKVSAVVEVERSVLPHKEDGSSVILSEIAEGRKKPNGIQQQPGVLPVNGDCGKHQSYSPSLSSPSSRKKKAAALKNEHHDDSREDELAKLPPKQHPEVPTLPKSSFAVAPSGPVSNGGFGGRYGGKYAGPGRGKYPGIGNIFCGGIKDLNDFNPDLIEQELAEQAAAAEAAKAALEVEEAAARVLEKAERKSSKASKKEKKKSSVASPKKTPKSSSKKKARPRPQEDYSSESESAAFSPPPPSVTQGASKSGGAAGGGAQRSQDEAKEGRHQEEECSNKAKATTAETPGSKLAGCERVEENQIPPKELMQPVFPNWYSPTKRRKHLSWYKRKSGFGGGTSSRRRRRRPGNVSVFIPNDDDSLFGAIIYTPLPKGANSGNEVIRNFLLFFFLWHLNRI